MESRTIDFMQGWNWIMQGWNLFLRNPLIWIVIAVVFGLIAVVLAMIPILGQIALGLIAPALMGGIYFGARELSQGRALEIPHLFEAFRDSTRTRPMLILGAVMMAVNLVIMALTFGMLGGAMMGGAMMGAAGHPGAMFGAIGFGAMLIPLIMLAIGALVTMAFFYAVPLVMFTDTQPVDAIKSSFNTCLKNILPMALFGIVAGVLMILSTITLMLGFLVTIPLLFAAAYCSYEDVYQAGTASA